MQVRVKMHLVARLQFTSEPGKESQEVAEQLSQHRLLQGRKVTMAGFVCQLNCHELPNLRRRRLKSTSWSRTSTSAIGSSASGTGVHILTRLTEGCNVSIKSALHLISNSSSARISSASLLLTFTRPEFSAIRCKPLDSNWSMPSHAPRDQSPAHRSCSQPRQVISHTLQLEHACVFFPCLLLLIGVFLAKPSHKAISCGFFFFSLVTAFA